MVRSDDARDESGELTDPGSALGTWSYMPPEQARGLVAEVDRRSDVFGLGAILAEILTGRPPYIGPDSMSVRLQAVEAASTRHPPGWMAVGPIQAGRTGPAVPRPEPCRPPGGRRRGRLGHVGVSLRRPGAPPAGARGPRTPGGAGGRRAPPSPHPGGRDVSVLVTLAVGVVASTIFALGERAARQKAAQEAIRATDNLAMARQVVDEMYTRAAGMLAEGVGIDADRRELLMKAARFYERFALPQSTEPASAHRGGPGRPACGQYPVEAGRDRAGRGGLRQGAGVAGGHGVGQPGGCRVPAGPRRGVF